MKVPRGSPRQVPKGQMPLGVEVRRQSVSSGADMGSQDTPETQNGWERPDVQDYEIIVTRALETGVLVSRCREMNRNRPGVQGS